MRPQSSRFSYHMNTNFYFVYLNNLVLSVAITLIIFAPTFFSSPMLCLTFISCFAAAQLSCQLSARDLSSASSAVDAAPFTLDPENCPYCAKALANESEGGTDGNETAGDSDSDGVYEFTQDLHHKDRRDSRQPRRKRLRLGKTAANVVRFWRLVCDTFRKIVDSKYFGRGIMIAILINTLSMGIEYHEQVRQQISLNNVFVFFSKKVLNVLAFASRRPIKISSQPKEIESESTVECCILRPTERELEGVSWEQIFGEGVSHTAVEWMTKAAHHLR